MTDQITTCQAVTAAAQTADFSFNVAHDSLSIITIQQAQST